VPSQQQPPHSAHLPRESHGYPYATSPYGYPFPRHPSRPESQIATTAASVPLPPKTPTTTSFAALQRQQYLQPFEHLFDTMETTRTLKATLDDQIRRSSSLMQTLQASATTLEGLIRNQIKEAQWEMMAQAEQKLEALIKRVDTLEGHASPTREDKAAAEDLVALSEKSYELQKPPTIVRSQNDIGPQEYYNMLNTLRDRLDRLERQIEA
jgi:BMFP domain-containing protein YqiC